LFNVKVTASNLVVSFMSEWLAVSKLVLRLDETNTIKFVTNKVFALLGCDALLIGI
jgi:hypothetical protein